MGHGRTLKNFEKKTSIQYSQEKRIMFKQFQQSNQKILEEIIYELREGKDVWDEFIQIRKEIKKWEKEQMSRKTLTTMKNNMPGEKTKTYHIEESKNLRN